VAEAYQMSWQLHDKAARVRTLIMVSRLGHCLNDLLFRWKTGALPIDVEGRMINIHHRSCRASRAPSLTTRPTRGASSWSAPPHTR
jgi:formyltetrahydrofolate hydrolase